MKSYTRWLISQGLNKAAAEKVTEEHDNCVALQRRVVELELQLGEATVFSE